MNILVPILLTLPLSGQTVDCAAELEIHLKSDLTLSYEEFDQTMGSGMRVLSAKGCHSESAELIEAYIAHNHATESSLRWHIAQHRAMAGEYDEAIQSAKAVLRSGEDLDNDPFRWNDYVLATIAFLEHDREALIRHRDNVAMGKDQHHGNAINLRLLDALVEHFGATYAEATRSMGSQ